MIDAKKLSALLRTSHDAFANLEGVSNDDLVNVLEAADFLSQSPAAQEGMLVPKEPTDEMLRAGNMAMDYLTGPNGRAPLRSIYASMLAAAPAVSAAPPAGGSDDGR